MSEISKMLITIIGQGGGTLVIIAGGVLLFTCMACLAKRKRLAGEALAIPEVLEVTARMTGEHNLLIKAIGAEDGDNSRVAQ